MVNEPMRYDLEFLEKLNDEYKDKPIQSTFQQYDHKKQFEYAQKRIQRLDKLIGLQGKKVLEIGCGGGYVSRLMAREYKCSVVGIDIYKSSVWEELGDENGLKHMVLDLSKENPFGEQSFDLIVSYVAWEHIRHPYKVLTECSKLIKLDGHVFIYANQYRSAVASHLYRTIHFPYPHLLFPDEVVIEYCLSKGITKEWIDAFYYVNKVTYAHYKEYFRILSFDLQHEKLYKRKLDTEFYERFYDKLSRYPVFDLELDFFEVILQLNQTKESMQKKLTCHRIDSDLPSAQSTGKIIKWTATADGEELSYAWYIYKEGERVETFWYTESNILEWTPSDTGKYNIKVFVKDGYGNKVSMISDDFLIE